MGFIKYSWVFTALLFSVLKFSNGNFFAVFSKGKAPSLTDYQDKAALQKSMARGKEVYLDFCIQCHMGNGKGDGKNFPPLDASDWLKKNINGSIHSIKFGQIGEIFVNGKKYNNNMPPMGLSNQEVADVMNYIRNSWSNKNPKMISLKQVEAIQK